MNGKKAKVLRRLASLTPEAQELRSYHGVENTLRNREVKNYLGEVVYRYRTATYKLNAGARLMYKMLKKAYKSQGSANLKPLTTVLPTT